MGSLVSFTCFSIAFLEIAISRHMSCLTIALALSSLYILAFPILRVVIKASVFSSSFQYLKMVALLMARFWEISFLEYSDSGLSEKKCIILRVGLFAKYLSRSDSLALYVAFISDFILMRHVLFNLGFNQICLIFCTRIFFSEATTIFP